ncbi:hypothetical protein C0993_012436 [Termitomyces sp. T159_Od127]|nr:hypothetical protein C0993_012436 [Termitomyces sp. T159_Od127]
MAFNEDRDRLFPATSIGRTAGSRLQRVPSKELLSAHPLLSSSHSSSSSVDNGSSQTTPRYLPYTPRQRVSPTAVTTGTTIHPPPLPHHQQGDATSKLQLVNLKAAAQNIGLDTGSLGWAILEKLVCESDHHDSEWTEIWSAITTGKSTLLLPLEPSSGHDKLTPEFLKDHIVLCDTPSRKSAAIVTLSGLRGTLNYNKLTFRSTIHPDSKTFRDLLLPSTRVSALSALPDLPLISPSSSYPAFTVPAHSSCLPLPPRTPPTKPPLPPRPGSRAVSSSSTTSSSRISNPFASLFGSGNSSTLNPAKSNTAVPSSPTGSVQSLDSTHSPDHVIEISAFTIDHKIVHKDIAKDMNKALRREVKAFLETGLHMPSWVGDRVRDFTAEWYPFVKEEKKKSLLLSRQTREKEKKENGEQYVISWTEEAPENTAERIQDFYLALEQELRLSEESFLGRLMKEHTEDSESTENEKRIKETIESEEKIKESMEVVERTICTLFYDRLFMQPTSDDLSHDQTLSSRVAALNMLDLGLEHLDIHVEHPSKELDLVIKECGETLSQLQSCRSPADKAALFVAAHKSVVDGLSRLPPIRLMSEEESRAQKAKDSPLARAKVNAPPREPDGTLKIMVSLGPSSSDVTTSGPPKPTEESVAEAPAKAEDNIETPLASTSAHQVHASLLPKTVEPELGSTIHYDSIQSPTPSLTTSTKPTPVSGDVLLPMIIFSVVKANPPHLVSSLLYTQRYRNQSIGGEESYCLVNLMAVAEFLENVDLAALGLGDSDKVLSAADLTPIPLNRSPITDTAPLVAAAGDGLPGKLRGGVEQANKVITGVMDTSFGMLRSLLPQAVPADATQQSGSTVTTSSVSATAAVPISAAKPGFGLLRRESGFSIRSLTAALDIGRGSSKVGEEVGQQLVAVSRPVSVKSARGDESGVEESESETETGDEDVDDEQENMGRDVDARSIRSFESMLSASSKGKRKVKKDKSGSTARKSLTDRLTHMSSLAGLKAENTPSVPTVAGSPPSSRPQSPEPQARSPLRLAPPITRFVECSAGELRLSEVDELLRDYRRLVEGIRAVKGFDE